MVGGEKAFRWATIGVWLAVAAAIASLFDVTLSDAGTTILSTVAVVQSVVFAVAFSVVVIGGRLSATRYAPRLADAFWSDPGYRWPVGVFALSLGSDVAFLYVYDSVQGYSRIFLVLVSGFLALGVLWMTYDFVVETLERTTPGGILSELERELTSSFVVESTDGATDRQAHRDPFLPLVSVIDSAIAEKDHVTATRGIDVLANSVTALLRDVDESAFERESPLDRSLGTLLAAQLPDVAGQARREDLNRTALEALDAGTEVGDVAVREGVDGVVGHVLRGQTALIDESGFDAGDDFLRAEVLAATTSLLRSAAENERWHSAATGVRLLGGTSAASIMHRGPGDVRDHGYTSLLVDGFPKLIAEATGSGCELTDSDPSVWIRGGTNDVRPIDRLVWSCVDSMAELSSAGIRVGMRTGGRFLTWSQVAHGWTEAFERLSETELLAAPRTVFGVVLYLEYVGEFSRGSVMAGFDPGATVSVDSDFAIDTIDSITDGELDPRALIDLVPGNRRPLNAPRTGVRDPPLRDADVTFDEWLETQRQVYIFR